MSQTADIISDVVKVVDDFTAVGKVFSAYDVTKEVNKNEPVAPHYKIKALVHGIFGAGEMGHQSQRYDRDLITLDTGTDDVDAWVYYGSSKTAYDHPLAKSQTVQGVDNGSGVPVLDLSSIGADDDDDTTTDDDEDEDTDDVVVTVTAENRIQIPKNILKQMSTDIIDEYIIYIDGRVDIRYVNTDGRIRVKTNLSSGDKMKIFKLGKAIHICPM